MPIYSYRGAWPVLGERVFLAPSADVCGDVTLGDDVSFWFQTAARGDVNRITIGARSNIQDGTVLHVTYKTHPLEIGEDVVIGHSAVVHGCVLESGCMVGMGARILDGCVIEEGAQIGAGAVVAPGTRVPAGHLALGVPAKVKRELGPEERQIIRDIADRYRRLKNEYLQSVGNGQNRIGEGSSSDSVWPEERVGVSIDGVTAAATLRDDESRHEADQISLNRALAPKRQRR